MKEDEKRQGLGLNTPINEIAGFCTATGYHVIPTGGGELELVRPLNPSRFYPRFHIKVVEDDSKIASEIHLDIKHHASRDISKDLSEELERLIKSLEAYENPSNFSNQLLSNLKYQALFGMAEAIKRRNDKNIGEVERPIFVVKKRRKMRGKNKARWLNQRYFLGEIDLSDM